MSSRLHSHIVMVGAAPGARGSVAAALASYRAAGLFARWPIEEAPRLGAFAAALARHPRMAVHLHVSRESFWRQAPFAAAALAMRCPLIVQLHGGGFGAEARVLLAHAAWVIVACEAQRLWVKNLVRGAEVVCVPPIAVPAPASAATRPNVVLFLGRLEAAKGIYDLLDALAGVRGAVPDVRLVCAGEGERAGIAHHAERLGIRDAVTFTGWVGPSGKRALLETAAAFVLPSYDEALPLSLVEAMSAGMPPLVSAVGGMPEAVQDGVSGLLVAPGDKASLERRLKRLLLDRALAARLGAAARESARRRFAPERVLPRLEEIYGAVGVAAAGTPASNLANPAA